MLRNIHDLHNLAVQATDGLIGEVKDFYFDDATWVVRYLIVSAGTWLLSRKVLISPIALGHPDWTARVLPVSITREQVRSSPDIDTNKPVSRQHEAQHLTHYGYPHYWGGTGLWGSGHHPGAVLPGAGYNPTADQYLAMRTEHLRAEPECASSQDNSDPHLRSCQAVTGYRIHASDGDIGHLQGMLIEDETWAIRYIVVNTSNWWLGHQLLVAPQWIHDVSWPEERVTVDLSRRVLKEAPLYDSSVPVDRTLEIQLFKHYGRATYWKDQTNQ